MDYAYPAIFHHNGDDGSDTIWFPDLPGCITESKTEAEAIDWARRALAEWLAYLAERGDELPLASSINDIETEPGERAVLIETTPCYAYAV